MRTTVFAVLLAAFCGQAAHAQTPPNVLYASAFHSQGLSFAGVKPWHVKIAYAIPDKKGELNVHGVFEEWWVSPHKYKLSYTRPGFNQTDYATDRGLYRVGDEHWPGDRELSIPRNLIDPLPNLQNNSELKPEMAPFAGTDKMRCIALTYPVAPDVSLSAASFPTYCIDQASPVLRLVAPHGPSKTTTFNRILRFQGHYVAGDLQMTSGGKPYLTSSMEVLELFQDAGDATFAPPANAALLSLDNVVVPESLQVIKLGRFVSPALAVQKHASGTVKLNVKVDRNGHVVEARVVSGPALLHQMVLDTVNQATFWPLQVMGEPVAVDMPFEVDVQF